MHLKAFKYYIILRINHKGASVLTESCSRDPLLTLSLIRIGVVLFIERDAGMATDEALTQKRSPLLPIS